MHIVCRLLVELSCYFGGMYGLALLWFACWAFPYSLQNPEGLFRRRQGSLHPSPREATAQSFSRLTVDCISLCAVVVSLPVDHESRDIGELAVWTATSAKSGNGVDLLRDGRDDTYWQSDGTQPHVITLSFQRKVQGCEGWARVGLSARDEARETHRRSLQVFMKKLAMLLDYRMDESYTPSKILVRVGDSLADLYDLRTVELAQPQGWAVIPLALDEDGECVGMDGDAGGAAASEPCTWSRVLSHLPLLPGTTPRLGCCKSWCRPTIKMERTPTFGSCGSLVLVSWASWTLARPSFR